MRNRNTKIKLRRLNKGTGWYEDGKLTQAGQSASSIMSGVGGAAGLAGAFIPQSEDQGSSSNYASSALSGVSLGIS